MMPTSSLSEALSVLAFSRMLRIELSIARWYDSGIDKGLLDEDGAA